MLQIVLYPFMVSALVGFLISLAVHLAALVGVEVPPQAFGLHVGIFIVWIPAVLASTVARHHSIQSRGWRDQFAGCPAWMRVVAYGLFAYAFLNIFGVVLGAGSIARGFSGHWMVFYWFAFTTLYGVRHLPHPYYCLAGHLVSPGAKYCERCGQPVIEG